jgi:hypothetical protein
VERLKFLGFAQLNSSQSETKGENYRGSGPPRAEYVRREIHFFVCYSSGKPALHVEVGMVCSRPLCYQTSVEPVRRRVD